MTIFQLVCMLQIYINGTQASNVTLFTVYGVYIAAEWIYFIVFGLFLRRKSFEVELIAFFLTGIGLTLTTSVYPDKAFTQLAAVLMGIIVFIVMLWILSDTKRVIKLRMPVAILAIAALIFTLIFGSEINGAKNWIVLGNGALSVQPSEIVKIAFVFVGAATLEHLQSTRSLTKYILFAVGCIGLLFLMKDFGTALIFFFTFIIMAFLRSGDIKTIFLVCAGAFLGGIGILTFKPYVAKRFESYRHIWEYASSSGYQQVRLLIYSVSGGLFGLGIGNGKLRSVTPRPKTWRSEWCVRNSASSSPLQYFLPSWRWWFTASVTLRRHVRRFIRLRRLPLRVFCCSRQRFTCSA